MVSSEQLFDQVSIDPDETVTATYEIDRTDAEAALFISGDSNSADITITFEVDPGVGQFFPKSSVDENNVDITGGEVFDHSLRPADVVRVSITNNGASATVIDAWIKRYLVVG